MGKRKSVDVWTMVMFANYNLKRQDITAERKKGICLMVEMILHHSGQYCGLSTQNTSTPVSPIENQSQMQSNMLVFITLVCQKTSSRQAQFGMLTATHLRSFKGCLASSIKGCTER